MLYLLILLYLNVSSELYSYQGWGEMGEADKDVPLKRLEHASSVLAGVVELLAAAGPDARVSPRGVGSLLAPALEEVREAERELRMTG